MDMELYKYSGISPYFIEGEKFEIGEEVGFLDLGHGDNIGDYVVIKSLKTHKLYQIPDVFFNQNFKFTIKS